MSGKVNEVDEMQRDRMEYLQYQATSVQDMVAQMQSTVMDFEDDMDDPFEQAMIVRDKKDKKYRRPNSDQSGNQSSSRENCMERGRPQRYCDKKRNLPYHDSAGGEANYFHGSNVRGSKHFRGALINKPVRLSSWRSQSTKYQRGEGKFQEQARSGSCQQYSSLEHDYSPRSVGENGQECDPLHLVEVLSEFPDFRATLLQLFEKRNMNPSAIRDVVSSHSNIFQINDEILKLHPEISLCLDHAGPQRCQRQSSCNDLHLCPVYLSSWCNEENCVLGHRWFTDHNKEVLQSFCIKELSVRLLRKLMQSLTVAAAPLGRLEICRKYNTKGCDKQDCDALHICQSFVAGRTKCTNYGCQLNHDILNSECCQLLRSHGFSTNEAPRDVVVTLISAYPSFATFVPALTADQEPSSTQHSPVATKSTTVSNSLSDKGNNNFTDNTTIKRSSSNRGIKNLTGNTIVNSSSSNEGIHSSSDVSVSEETTKTLMTSSKGRKNRFKNDGNRISDNKTGIQPRLEHTVWSHELRGDTLIGEICYYSVESSCRHESSGCPRLHSSEYYHWQVSENGSNWVNLPSNQVTTLECSFCYPAKDTVKLPCLDPGKLDPLLKGLFTIMGRDIWQASFPAMVLTNSDYSRILYLRRLCTEPIPGKVIKSSLYCWYFLDNYDKWVQYGNIDTAGETNLVSSVTSDDIEKHCIQNPGVSLNFKNASNTYILDFNAMTQTNKRTQVSREVRRRPKPHMKMNRKEDESFFFFFEFEDSSGISSIWETMQPEERVRLVSLDSSSAEYQSIVNLLNIGGLDSSTTGVPRLSGWAGRQNGNLLPRNIMRMSNRNVVKIERIQNPFLLKAFQNKVKEMTLIYGDIKKVDVRRLFHATKSNVVSSICAENFDWRLHGISSGEIYGQGTYFSPNATTSMGYLTADTTGLRYLFVARVAVGSIIQGNSSMARPPINQATGAPYDSTGDGVNVIVKYDKQEYYPEYVITVQ